MRRKSVKDQNRDLKIIIVGDSGTGKTSFVNKYILNKFADTYQATIATQFSSKILEIDGITYRLQFWDIAGQDRSVTTTNIFCKNTNGVVLCCEINDKNTLNNTVIWKNSIEQNIDVTNVPMIIIKNKCDLLGSELEYNNGIEELQEFTERNGIKNCFRTSAMTGFGIQESMEYLINEIIKVTEFKDNEGDSENRETVAISDKPRTIRGKKSGCC
jgi:small GTP-binding protein